MTPIQFNKKYNDYLETGHYGLDIYTPEIVEYLDKEFTDLIKIPGFRYSQIKLKFGTSRFYAEAADPEPIRTRVEEIEKQIDYLVKLDISNNR